MKKLMGLLVTMSLATPAFASMSTEQFIDTLVDTVNQQLIVLNKERKSEGKKLYCSQLTTTQVNSMASRFMRKDGTFKSLASISQDRFVLIMGDELNCYPKTCKAYADLVHGICNMKAAKMDRDLLDSALEKIKGSKVYATDTMADVAR
ncbi:MAG: hypothetical protein J7501_06815 [Bdellovibrio sp.]|nr:hypothetical protein [Bdellovibrio sp.]